MYDVERMELSLRQGAIRDRRPSSRDSRAPGGTSRIVELALEGGRYRIVRSQGGVPLASAPAAHRSPEARSAELLRERRGRGRTRLPARRFRSGMSNDTTAMMGGGLCWLDYDEDGWLDLFVVNSYAMSTSCRGTRRAGSA